MDKVNASGALQRREDGQGIVLRDHGTFLHCLTHFERWHRDCSVLRELQYFRRIIEQGRRHGGVIL